MARKRWCNTMEVNGKRPESRPQKTRMEMINTKLYKLAQDGWRSRQILWRRKTSRRKRESRYPAGYLNEQDALRPCASAQKRKRRRWPLKLKIIKELSKELKQSYFKWVQDRKLTNSSTGSRLHSSPETWKDVKQERFEHWQQRSKIN